eukprot:gnl/TRDRNA2_/TRDRNA2_182868_c0_seq1.p1 gnl/TRDRNA2_/TRDRNA2_182868_c0~~gnl/TRDRNA2_/TRDRNA2_182868_c0_seq1.p1  ORF type:complete len:214 (-),score=34.78 gnl/TRDRNA2_/TRDRNA2_182868_c0_seq1:125-670(-)
MAGEMQMINIPTPRRRWRGGLERTIPRGGATDDLFARYFSEVTLDAVEEQTFRKRYTEEVGPRHVHLRQNALGEVTLPPHIEENQSGDMVKQMWSGHPKVDRSMFIMDRINEGQARMLRDLHVQRHVPALRAAHDPALCKKNFGAKSGPAPLKESFRSIVLNSPRRPPAQKTYIDRMAEFN